MISKWNEAILSEVADEYTPYYKFYNSKLSLKNGSIYNKQDISEQETIVRLKKWTEQKSRGLVIAGDSEKRSHLLYLITYHLSIPIVFLPETVNNILSFPSYEQGKEIEDKLKSYSTNRIAFEDVGLESEKSNLMGDIIDYTWREGRGIIASISISGDDFDFRYGELRRSRLAQSCDIIKL